MGGLLEASLSTHGLRLTQAFANMAVDFQREKEKLPVFSGVKCRTVTASHPPHVRRGLCTRGRETPGGTFGASHIDGEKKKDTFFKK